MKKKLIIYSLLVCSTFILASCGPESTIGGGTDNTSTFVDSRTDAFTVVSGEMTMEGFVPDGDEVNFKSLYEAANYLFDNCDNGSYVKKLGDTTNTILFQKRGSESSISGATTDQFWYYANGTTVNGYSAYFASNYELFNSENVSVIMASTDNLKQYYQPYGLIAGEGHSETTASWNHTPLLDTTIRYNPIAFSGMRSITYNFDLSEAKIRPSYNETQKAVPMITLSSTDSYNWSNQGIYMDTDTGDWYYLYGETQADSKFLEYDTEEVILGSTWNAETQEYTPNGDVKMTLNYVFSEESETWSNDLIIEVTYNNGDVKTFNKNYEYSAMNGRGTPRANIALDLISSDEDYDETSFSPDFMCGSYFKNIVITEAKGTVPEGLTDDEYQGDTDMQGVPGTTYDLTTNDLGSDIDMEIILDHYDAITFHEDATNGDVFDIDYTPVISEATRTAEVLEAEELIGQIKDTDTAESASVILASQAYNALDAVSQKLVRYIDGYTQLEEALER